MPSTFEPVGAGATVVVGATVVGGAAVVNGAAEVGATAVTGGRVARWSASRRVTSTPISPPTATARTSNTSISTVVRRPRPPRGAHVAVVRDGSVTGARSPRGTGPGRSVATIRVGGAGPVRARVCTGGVVTLLVSTRMGAGRIVGSSPAPGNGSGGHTAIGASRRRRGTVSMTVGCCPVRAAEAGARSPAGPGAFIVSHDTERSAGAVRGSCARYGETGERARGSPDASSPPDRPRRH